MTDTPKLKPCPFCGGTEIGHGYGRDWLVRSCMTCAAEGPIAYGSPEHDKTWTEADAAWNTRAEVSQAAVEALEAKLEESEARSEVLETLIMDVAADLYDGVAAHKIDQRIMDVIRQLNEVEEDQ